MNKFTAFCKKYVWTVVVLAAIVLWYWIATENNWLDGTLFPTIGKIGDAFVRYADVMPLNLWYSLGLLIPSMIISTLLAFGLGMLMGTHKRLRDALYPIIYAISVVPSILLSPFAINIASSFYTASVFLIVYGTISPTLFATITGIVTIDKRYLDNADTLCLTGWKRMTKIVLPAAMPSILSGFVTSLRASFLTLVFAEMYSAQYGLGHFVKRYSDFSLFDATWAGFLFMVVILVVVMQIFETIKNRMLHWTID